MDRVVVGGDRLERGKMCFGHRAARDIKPLTNRQILEITGLPNAVLTTVEARAHNASK